MLGVSAWLTSRIGTRSGPTYTLRELGSGLIAASSTWAVEARNFDLVFISLPSAPLPASGSKELSHPSPDPPEQDPCVPPRYGNRKRLTRMEIIEQLPTGYPKGVDN